MMEKEIFMPIPKYEKEYLVSNLGRVKSLKYGKILKPRPIKKGYVRVSLCKNSNAKDFYISRLVMLAFVGKSNLEVDHISGDKSDNRIINLRYCTHRENKSFPNQKGFLKKTSKYVGVCKVGNRWLASIRINGDVFNIGYFGNEIDASNAYQQKLSEINKKIA